MISKYLQPGPWEWHRVGRPLARHISDLKNPSSEKAAINELRGQPARIQMPSARPTANVTACLPCVQQLRDANWNCAVPNPHSSDRPRRPW